MSLRSDIEKTRKRLKILESDFKEVKYYAYKDILETIGEKFTDLGKRADRYFWFNHNLKGDTTSFHPKTEEDVTNILKEIIPGNPVLYFIGAETYKERAKYWVYESNLETVTTMIYEIYLFDFYLVDKKYKWLVTEEHHGVILASGFPVASNLQKYKQSY